MRIDRLKIFLDSMGGGAWPFLVGGVSCLVDSVNERDLCCIIGGSSFCVKGGCKFVGIRAIAPAKFLCRLHS